MLACIRRELFILHTTLRTVTDVKRRYTKHCVHKMADSSRPGKFLTLLTLERSSFRENATLEATFFTRSICQDLNEPLNVPQTAQKRADKQTNKQTDSRTLYPCCACAHPDGSVQAKQVVKRLHKQPHPYIFLYT